MVPAVRPPAPLHTTLPRLAVHYVWQNKAIWKRLHSIDHPNRMRHVSYPAAAISKPCEALVGERNAGQKRMKADARSRPVHRAQQESACRAAQSARQSSVQRTDPFLSPASTTSSCAMATGRLFDL